MTLMMLPVVKVAGARLGCGRHRVAIIRRYDCYVTDAGTAACHGYWKGGVSRISGDGGRKRLAGQRVGWLGRRARAGSREGQGLVDLIYDQRFRRCVVGKESRPMQLGRQVW